MATPPEKKPELKFPSSVDRAIAEQLVEQAQADGVDLVCPGALLGDLTKQILETRLEVEMDEHLGYEKDAAERRDGANSCNGIRLKMVITEVGPVEIDTPRDRDGTSEPATVKKCQRRLEGVAAGDLTCSASWPACEIRTAD